MNSMASSCAGDIPILCISFRDEALALSGAGKILKRELRAPFWQGRDRQVG
ncbi:MAG TPA: hypothetical protein VI566_04990 [Xanthomonadales bacterium]|nr:hypothetical protein [Xanthomonadales bacterium]